MSGERIYGVCASVNTNVTGTYAQHKNGHEYICAIVREDVINKCVKDMFLVRRNR